MKQLKSFDNFLSESISYAPDRYSGTLFTAKPDDSSTIENLKAKSKLKKGDKIIVTGPKNLIVIDIAADHSGNSKLQGRVFKGDEINDWDLSFDRWINDADIKKLSNYETAYGSSSLNGNDYRHSYAKTSEVLNGLLLGYCKDDNGKEYLLSLYTYNSKYIKSEPKIPDTFDENQLKALCSHILPGIGIDDFTVDNSSVKINTWFVYANNHTGSESLKVAGPFGKKKDAEKKLKEIGNIKGDLDYDILNKLRLRVASKESPSALYVMSNSSVISHKEFTAALKKSYNTDKLLKELRGSVKGHKFNI